MPLPRQYKTFDAQAIWMHSLIERRMWIHQTTTFYLCPDNVHSSLYTLSPTPNWSPYILTLVQKAKIGHKKSCFYKQTKVLPRLCKLFHSKITCTFCTVEVRVKVHSFQNVTQFLHFKIVHRDSIRLFFVCLKIFLTAVI